MFVAAFPPSAAGTRRLHVSLELALHHPLLRVSLRCSIRYLGFAYVMASASNPVPTEDGPKLVTEEQYKAHMAFCEGKIAGLVQAWRSTAPSETKQMSKLVSVLVPPQ